ncbi:MAG TPA: S8 family serine peptidase [Gaiellaceae bacterium]|nr:S8 family serine peptidase [Gaiellaceae bacterium]
MRTPRAERRHAVLFLVAAAAATAALLAAAKGSGREPAPAVQPGGWAGLVASRPPVAIGPRVIVLLRAPSLAQRVAAARGAVSGARERAWTNGVLAAQRHLLARLAAEGVSLRPDYSFSRVVDGFSAVAGADAVALLERDPAVAGVYPVRAAYPATSSATAGGAAGPAVRLAGADGHGVTVALLDTAVDPTVPSLHGRVGEGIDLVGGEPAAGERHGTETAGLLVGTAPGASVLPIRVAGRQQDALGRWAVYARSDQLVAGLDRAVDPNDDGDARDAARVALVPLAEPFAGFADSPEARAVAGALALDTLVVAPAGNDGGAGISGPGGAPAALTVGAADTRPRTAEARVVVRVGLATLFAGRLALAGAVAPRARTSLEVVTRRGSRLTAFFSRGGTSLVAGRAALVAPRAVGAATTAGASAVLLDRPVPAGALGVNASVPVVALPGRVVHALRARLDAGETATVALGAAPDAANVDSGRVAAFSSTGLAFDGRVKPDLVGPGVALTTADPGGGSVTVNGTSAAAAVVAGAAALVTQTRPRLDAAELAGLLTGTARPLQDDPLAAQGSGLVDVQAAAAAPLAAAPATLALPRDGTTTLTLTNLFPRTVRATLSVRRLDHGAAAAHFAVNPRRLLLRPGRSAVVRLDVAAQPDAAAMEGVLVARAGEALAVRVPWAIAPAAAGPLLRKVTLAPRAFAPSDTSPAVLTVDAGSVANGIRPLARLDVELLGAGGRRLGLLARLRDVLPGRTVFGITGRDPSGRPLPPGTYAVRVTAVSVDGAVAARRKARFSLR